jgi:hypothetical protein
MIVLNALLPVQHPPLSNHLVLVFLVVHFLLSLKPITYTRFSHPYIFHRSHIPWRRVQVMKLLIMQLSHPPVTSHLLGPNILLCTLYSSTPSLCSPLNVRDQVSHAYRTTGYFAVLHIPSFMFLDNRREGRCFWIEW